MIPILFVLGSMLANLLTAILVPLLFIYQVEFVTVGTYRLSLVDYGFYGLLVYVALNFLSAQRRPGENVYFYMDLVPSLVAAGSIITVGFLVFSTGASDAFIAGIQGAKQQLGALLAFALIDIFINQWPNVKEAGHRLRHGQSLSGVPVVRIAGEGGDTRQQHEEPMQVHGLLVLEALSFRRPDGSVSPPRPFSRVIEHIPQPAVPPATS